MRSPENRLQSSAQAPAQLGFGFEVMDAHGRTPAFLHEEKDVREVLDKIAQAQWVSVDVETTGLTEASVPVTLSRQEQRQDASNVVRMRTIQARIPTVEGVRGRREDFAFDADKMGSALTREVARVLLSRKLLIAHNAGFDLYWLRRAEGRIVMPEIVADTMLLTRLLQPEIVLKRAELIEGIASSSAIPLASEEVQAAWNSLLSGASGASLADVVLAMFGRVVDKTCQKPNNWTGLLGFEHYDYAIDDVVWADRILCKLLGVVTDEGDLLQAYLTARSSDAFGARIRLIEPQVPDLVRLREAGMPMNRVVALNYTGYKARELVLRVNDLIEIEPLLGVHREILLDPEGGTTADLKKTLAHAFEVRGVHLRRTVATSTPQIGEKDLRACKAAKIDEAKPLFDAWVALCKAKKVRKMALETIGFAERSDDGRLHSLLSHGPVTGRLSASEPNCQQWPRDQLFRAMCMSEITPGKETLEIETTEFNQELVGKAIERIESNAPPQVGTSTTVETGWFAALFYSDASVFSWPVEEYEATKALIDDAFTHVLVASDFGALDVRVGAALCIRAQREMIALVEQGSTVPGGVKPPDAVVTVLRETVGCLGHEESTDRLSNQERLYRIKVERLATRIDDLRTDLENGRIAKSQYWRQRNAWKAEQLAMKLGMRLAQCLRLASTRGEREYSALRDAFVAEIDIHTFTGMKLVGRDPMKEFEGLGAAQRKALEKKLKKEIGSRRQQGKIANLSLLYGMADAGFQEAAARGYNEHWTLEESANIRNLWMDAYPEVELWHLWTECLRAGVVYVPENGRDKPTRTPWWRARTLSGREIVAFGLNAALSYQDQSSGADILGLIMHRLQTEYPDIFATSINQVHDEQVFCFPKDRAAEYLEVVERVMVEAGNSQTMPYGVPTAVSPACGPLWVKD